jgi:hypothetical protein
VTDTRRAIADGSRNRIPVNVRLLVELVIEIVRFSIRELAAKVTDVVDTVTAAADNIVVDGSVPITDTPVGIANGQVSTYVPGSTIIVVPDDATASVAPIVAYGGPPALLPDGFTRMVLAYSPRNTHAVDGKLILPVPLLPAGAVNDAIAPVVSLRIRNDLNVFSPLINDIYLLYHSIYITCNN